MTANMTTSNPDTLWTTHASEEYEEADEPPELRLKHQLTSEKFQKTAIRRPNEKSSLLTKAIMGTSDDDSHTHHYGHEVPRPILSNAQRRRSLASNISLASTADLTSDTGLTSPSRPNTPSPPLPEMTMLRLDGDTSTDPKRVSLLGAAVRFQSQPQSQPAAETPRKRSIQFACVAKPLLQEAAFRAQPMVKMPSAQEAPRRPCIKFACPARPASTQNTPPRRVDSHMGEASRTPVPESPSTPKRGSILASANSATLATPRQITPRRPSTSRPKFLRADSKDLVADGCHFHQFASGISREDDWIRQGNPPASKKLTINDTLTKENRIRRLAAEAEEEAEEEDELNADEDIVDDEDDEDDELDLDLDDDDVDDEYEDDDEDEDDDDGDSDGYRTDEETGFADSDDDEVDDDDDMALWTPSQKSVVHISSSRPVRRMSLHEQSDSSIATQTSHPPRERGKRVKRRDETPDLPDSTDFVCGTLDEDRPLEEAYMSCLAARRNEKLRIIPQDFDPSFPASEPEEDNDGEIFNPVHHESDDDDDWLHGKMDDIHHETERSRRRRKSNVSPKRYRSPPPKRHHSPPPKRGRSPKPLFDRPSPRKARSPGRARKPVTTPLGSPRCGQVKFNLAGRPGLTHTKSLPRAGAMFLLRQGRQQKANQDRDVHVRGAIDIVKGLESKRARRKEKFVQKYCNRARRGQLPERRAMPGRGAERMKELGLLMAGKKDQGNYILSV